jgi:hypothetical protein
MEVIPEGVRVLKTYRSGLSLLECDHDKSERGEKDCGVCRADARSTQGYTLPVKLLREIPKGQVSMF